MPLYERQHLIDAVGPNFDAAQKALREQLNDLPIVRIVQLATSTFPVSMLGRSFEGVRLIAVVEEI